jgi:hypothetical protein
MYLKKCSVLYSIYEQMLLIAPLRDLRFPFVSIRIKGSGFCVGRVQYLGFLYWPVSTCFFDH